MNLKIVVQPPDMSWLRVSSALLSILICRKIPSEMERDEISHAENKKYRNVLDYNYVDHHIKIIGHDRDYSNVDVHDKAVASTKTEKRPTEKHAESKMLVRCLLGKA